MADVSSWANVVLVLIADSLDLASINIALHPMRLLRTIGGIIVSKMRQSLLYVSAVCVVFAGFTAQGGDVITGRRLTPITEDMSIPARIAGEIYPEENSFCQLPATTYRKHRNWFLYKLSRLKTFTQTTITGKELVADWEEKYHPTLLAAQVRSGCPDLHLLREIYTDKYETFVEDDRFDALVADRFHILTTTARAFRRYLVTMEDFRNPVGATDRLRSNLTELKMRLEAYSQGRGAGQVTDYCIVNPELDQIRAIHAVVKRIEVSEQVPELTTRLRSHYMQPKARLYLSAPLLSKTINVELPTTEIIRNQSNANLRGSATPHSRLFVYCNPNEERAELGVAYRGMFTFCGTLNVTSPIKRTTGLQMGLFQNTSKTFLIEAKAPDSNRARSATSMTYAKTQRGKIFDWLVTPSLRENVPKDPINEKIMDGIDTAVTELSNFIPTRSTSLLDTFSGEVYYPRERRYSTTGRGVEVVVYSAQSGFLPSPLVLPNADYADFDFTLHASIQPTRCSSKEIRGTVKKMIQKILSPESAENLRNRIVESGITLDRTDGRAIEFVNDRVVVKLRTTNLVPLTLYAIRKTDGSLGFEYESDDVEGIETAKQMLTDFEDRVAKARYTLPNIKNLFPSQEERNGERNLVNNNSSDADGQGLRILYDNGYVSLQGILNN